jgi:hypothetical protein
MLRCLIFGVTVLSTGQLLAADYKINNPSTENSSWRPPV